MKQESAAQPASNGNPAREKQPNPRVGLFITCLVDLFRPTVGFSAVALLEDAGCTVEVPQAQTCCGQPAYNSGDREDARAIARATVKAFQGFDYVVAPSGSCAAMIREHYPRLFRDAPDLLPEVEALAGRTHELTSFLVDVCRYRPSSQHLEESVTYHDGCSGLRELGVSAQPRQLLQAVESLELKELQDREVCCGFGGTFCVKYPDISNAMVQDKSKAVQESGAEMLLAGELGCLMNIAGKLRRQGSEMQVRHVAEVLAGQLEAPSIGSSDAEAASRMQRRSR
ncbi:MAG: (Fe-S)-binding protein [Pseudomonadota bacterium]|uniref:(Fe-S)-binding protein n=1 Tax=Fodinicurvata fenggangensis TaxID=1121830 RepID=UPI00068E12DB|nr:(Fe-S)-binding protein [Fodinicurvata fenggangensis]